MIIRKYNTEEEWLQARVGKLTGTWAPTLMEVGYKDRKITDLYNEIKYNNDNSKKRSARLEKAAQRGKRYEPLLAEMFSVRYPEYEVEHHDLTLIESDIDSRIQGSLDGILTDSEGRRGILEIKTTHIDCSSAWVRKNALDALEKRKSVYYWQVIHYLLVTGFDFAVIELYKTYNCKTIDCPEKEGCEFIGSSGTHFTYKIERAEAQEDIDRLKQRELSFLADVDAGVLPGVKI